MLKTLKIQKSRKIIEKNQFCHVKGTYHFTYRGRLRQTVCLENAITEDKMSLRTSALAHFIQNKLYLQYIFIILL